MGFALLLSACAAGADSRSGIDVPTEGTIIFHDPAPRGSVVQTRRHKAMTRVFILADDELAQENSEVQVFSGTTPLGADEDQIARRRLARQLYEASRRRGEVRLLPREKFSELWRLLQATGLFDIPPERSTTPPQDRPYFQLKADGREWIITRPRLTELRADAPSTKQRESWTRAKIVLVEFENRL